MCVVAHPALLKPDRIVSMDLREVITLVTIETPAFKDKTTAPVQTMALGALHARNRRMLVKSLKRRRWIRTNKKMHFLSAAFPLQNQRVQASGRFQCGVKHIRKGLLGLDGDTVQFELSRRCGGNQIDLPGCIG